MDRGSDKHGPRMDEELDQEIRGLTRGAPGDARAEEWRKPEPSGDDEPPVSLNLEPDMRDERAELAAHLRRSAFPATRHQLIREAEANQAPDRVLTELGRLDGERQYTNVAEVWSALTGEPVHEQRF